MLSRTGGTPQAEQPVTRWPRRPGLAEDLPPGPVRDRILVLTSPRALLPIVKAVSTVTVTRLLNADGKTVARLVVDHVTVTAPTGNTGGGTTAELPPRLAVAYVRGYPGQAHKAAALLAGVPGVAHASQSVFTAALTALGRHPADYTSGVEAEITATMPAPVAVAKLLLRLLDTMELNVPGVLRDIDTEFLHDFRVAVRRTRSVIKLARRRPARRPGRALQPRVQVARRRDHPGPATSTSTCSSSRPDGRQAGRRGRPADLEPLRAFLVRRRAQRAPPAGPRRCAGRGSEPVARTTGARRCSSSRDAGTARAGARAAAVALARLRPGAVPADRPRTAARSRPPRPPRPCTTCASGAKELRYLLECFAPLLDPGAYRRCVSELKAPPGRARRRSRTARCSATTIHALRRRDAGRDARLRPLRCWPWVRSPRSCTRARPRPARSSPPGSQRSRSARAGRTDRLPRRRLERPRGRVKISPPTTSRAASGRRRRPSTSAYLAAARRLPDAALGPRPAGRGHASCSGSSRGSRAAARRSSAAPATLDDAIKGTDFDRLDLLPADFTYRNLDLVLDDADEAPTRRLAQLLDAAGRPSTTSCSSTARRASRWSRRTSSTPPTCCWCR